uniref:Uncharacterized protein n=1 Tax=Clastoptera arizonana TaxID=38151 RepID=A0A1B6CSX3_9HEMI
MLKFSYIVFLNVAYTLLCEGSKNIDELANDAQIKVDEILVVGKILSDGLSNNMTDDFAAELISELQDYSKKCKEFITIATDMYNPLENLSVLCEKILVTYPLLTELNFDISACGSYYSVKDFRILKKEYSKAVKLIKQINAIKQRSSV